MKPYLIVLIVIGVLIFLTLLISFIVYFLAFFNNTKKNDFIKNVMKGEQYDKYHDEMIKLIDDALVYKYEDVYITTFDKKKLHARYYHVKDGAPILIQCHGYKGNCIRDFAGGLKYSIDNGNNVLLIDQRAHGLSQGRTITFGVKERKDVICWIDYVNKRFGDNIDIFLYGISMGAATVLMVSDLVDNKKVKGIIADCPFSSPKEIILKVIKDIKLPVKLMKPFVVLGAFIFGHFNINSSSAIKSVKKTNIPIFIVHGTDDRFVPNYMSKEIKNANPDIITQIDVEGAPHGLSFIVDNEKYVKELDAFINRIYEKQ